MFGLNVFLTNTNAQIIRHVLFLGNSYTYVNDLPQITADLAASLGDSLIFDSNTPGGYTLDQHFTNSVSTGKIMAGGWDYVVMQEQSQLPSFQYYDVAGPYVLSTLIRQYNPCARKMFYMTWGRKNGDASNCNAWLPVCTYSGMDSMLRLRYIEMAQENNGEVSPVGAVWRYIRQNYPNIDLYQADESHPSTAGSYAAACCFYAALFKKDPTTSNFDYVLSPADAAAIRNAAKLIVYDSLSYWNFSQYNPLSDFSYTIGPGTNEVILINHSMNSESYHWDFGDGDTASAFNTTHNYLSNGTYTITLTSSVCDLTQIYQSVFQLPVTFCIHNPTIFPDSLIICPGSPVDSLWTQPYDSYQWLDESGNIIPDDTNQYISPSAPATYSVLATQNGCTELSPPVYVDGFGPGIIIYRVDTAGTFFNGDSVCFGDMMQLILLQNKPGGVSNIITWYRNGIPVSAPLIDTLEINTGGVYNVEVTNPVCPGYIIYQSQLASFTLVNCNTGIDDESYLPIIVYPNPSNNIFSVKFDLLVSQMNYSVYDITGRIIDKGVFEKGINFLNAGKWNSGIYFLRTDEVVGNKGMKIKLIVTVRK